MEKNEALKIVVKCNEEESKQLYKLAQIKGYKKNNKKKIVVKAIVSPLLAALIYLARGFLLGFVRNAVPEFYTPAKAVLSYAIIYLLLNTYINISLLVGIKRGEKQRKADEYASAYTFGKDAVTLESPFVKINFEYEPIYRAFAVAEGLAICFENREYHLLPWRFIGRERYAQLAALLKEKLGERFIQEEEPNFQKTAEIIEESPKSVSQGELISEHSYNFERKTIALLYKKHTKRNILLLVYSVLLGVFATAIVGSTGDIDSFIAVIVVYLIAVSFIISSIVKLQKVIKQQVSLSEKLNGKKRTLKLFKDGILLCAENDSERCIPFDSKFSWREDKKLFEMRHTSGEIILLKSKDNKEIIEQIKQTINQKRISKTSIAS